MIERRRSKARSKLRAEMRSELQSERGTSSWAPRAVWLAALVLGGAGCNAGVVGRTSGPSAHASDEIPATTSRVTTYRKDTEHDLEGPALGEKPAPAPVGGGARALPSYRLEPVDLTTSAAGTPLQLWLSDGGRALGEERLARIGQAIALVTWPEQEVVATTVRLRDARAGGDSYARVYLEPREPLPDRWYALRAPAALPDAEPADDPANALVLPNGTRFARFRPGSEPLLVSVRQHPKGDGQYAVVFDFSERIEASLAETLGLVAISDPHGKLHRCTGATAAPGRSFSSLGLSCDQPILEPGVRIGLREGLWSRGGSPLRADSREIAQAELVPRRDGGQYLRFLRADARLRARD